MMDLDAQIEKAHRGAEEAEATARQLEERICRIPGAARCLPRRQYGAPVDPAAIRQNLTLAGLIARHDAPLAAFLGVATGAHLREAEAAAARAAAADRMREATEATRARNHAAAMHRERAALAGINPVTGRRWA